MKCVICHKPAANGSVVCTDKCNDIRLTIYHIVNKYRPTNGCENCRGDLHQGCIDECRRESEEASMLAKDLWGLVRKSLAREEES